MAFSVNNYVRDVAYKGPKQVTVTNGARTESDSRYKNKTNNDIFETNSNIYS